MGLEGRRVLFISYNGMLDPLGQTQVIPYLSELTKRGVEFTLLSFERAAAFEPEGIQKCEELREVLRARGIEWHWLRYHQRPSLPATIYDVVVGIRKARSLVRRNKIEMVHARAHIPATIALALKKSLGTKMIFDLRGLMAEEYVDAGHWQKNSLPYRITKAAERRIFTAADAVVTLTEKIWPIIKEWDGLRGRDVPHAVIPCCVDLSLFNFSEEDRVRRRTELALDDQFTIVYSGSLDGWYLTEQMADFFAALNPQKPDAHLVWLTNGSHERIRALMSSRNIAPDRFSVLSVPARLVPSYLAAADAGLSFIKRCVSKLASSPTKNGEYLACGLPLIINAGIGDSDALVEEWKAGVLLEEFNEAEYARIGNLIEEMAAQPDARRRARLVAEQLFDLQTVGAERYASLYERVY
ncbi:MAG TPA: glycosyltransferase family 4 protein [Pyrinomonadaceae bacterium]|nr:glycosyltransferase family 4 protein [Pyrinomonadaceae bacterium]